MSLILSIWADIKTLWSCIIGNTRTNQVNIDFSDSTGNNDLHTLVRWKRYSSNAFADSLCRSMHNLQVHKNDATALQTWLSNTERQDILFYMNNRNNDGLTPLGLSAKCGLMEIFELLLEVKTSKTGSHGTVVSLDDLDDLGYKEKNEIHDGVFKIIIDNEQYDLLGTVTMKTLITAKWQSLVLGILFQRFFWYCVYLVCLSIFTFGRNKQKVCSHEWVYRLLLFVVSIVPLLKMMREVFELYSSGLSSYCSVTGSAFAENVLSFLCGSFMVIFLICHVFRINSTSDQFKWLEGWSFSIASCLAALYSLFFLMAWRFTGPVLIRSLHDFIGQTVCLAVISVALLAPIVFLKYSFDDESGVNVFQEIVNNVLSTELKSLFGDDAKTPQQEISLLSPGTLLIFFCLILVQLINKIPDMIEEVCAKAYEGGAEGADAQLDYYRRWEIEQARILFAVENEMTVSERLRAYRNSNAFVIIDGVLHLKIPDVYRAIATDSTASESSEQDQVSSGSLSGSSATAAAIISQPEQRRSPRSTKRQQRQLQDEDDLGSNVDQNTPPNRTPFSVIDESKPVRWSLRPRKSQQINQLD